MTTTSPLEREALDLIEEILLMTDERDDSIPLIDWLPNAWVDRAIALHDRDSDRL